MNPSDDRDRAIERLLQHSFNRPPPPGDACLDAETLAAWADGGLSSVERASVESHVADCARCQAVVSTAARLAAIAPARPEPAPRRWLPWLVPLASAAAVAAIWVAVARAPGAPAQDYGQAFRATPPESQATNTLQPPPAPARQEHAAAAQKSDQPVRDQSSASALSKDADRRELDRLKQEPQSADAAADRVDTLRAAAEPAAAPPPAAAAPSTAPVARSAFESRSANRAATSEQVAAGSAVASVALTPRWRISGTVLERSTNGGTTWSPVVTGVTSELTAVSSPSNTVSWVVGRRGVVLRTTDGETFSRVAFPEMTDLSAVQASDAQSVTVTASDGRVFRTSDGGATWQDH